MPLTIFYLLQAKLIQTNINRSLLVDCKYRWANHGHWRQVANIKEVATFKFELSLLGCGACTLEGWQFSTNVCTSYEMENNLELILKFYLFVQQEALTFYLSKFKVIIYYDYWYFVLNFQKNTRVIFLDLNFKW